MTKKPLLEAKELSIGYQKPLYNNIHFQLFSGEMIGVLGANGRGKTTLLKTLMGGLAPLKGEITVNGSLLHQLSRMELAQNMSVVLTEMLPETHLTVKEIIELGRYPYTDWSGKLRTEDHNKVKELIAFTQLSSLEHQRVTELSDGQKQNVMIARALAQDTPLVLLDEPTAHLDIPNKIKLFKRLRAWCNETQKCFLYATHDIDLALQMSDRLMVLTSNHIVINTPEQLIQQDVMDQLFEGDDVFFDRKTQKFLAK